MSEFSPVPFLPQTVVKGNYTSNLAAIHREM